MIVNPQKYDQFGSLKLPLSFHWLAIIQSYAVWLLPIHLISGLLMRKSEPILDILYRDPDQWLVHLALGAPFAGLYLFMLNKRRWRFSYWPALFFCYRLMAWLALFMQTLVIVGDYQHFDWLIGGYWVLTLWHCIYLHNSRYLKLLLPTWVDPLTPSESDE